MTDDMLQVSHEWTCEERKRVGFTFVSAALNDIQERGRLDEFDLQYLEYAQMVLSNNGTEFVEIYRDEILSSYQEIRAKWRSAGQRRQEPPVPPLRRLFRAIVGIRS